MLDVTRWGDAPFSFESIRGSLSFFSLFLFSFFISPFHLRIALKHRENVLFRSGSYVFVLSAASVPESYRLSWFSEILGSLGVYPFHTDRVSLLVFWTFLLSFPILSFDF